MLSSRSILFFLLLSALNDLIGPSAGPLAQTAYSIPYSMMLEDSIRKAKQLTDKVMIIGDFNFPEID